MKLQETEGGIDFDYICCLPALQTFPYPIPFTILATLHCNTCTLKPPISQADNIALMESPSGTLLLWWLFSFQYPALLLAIICLHHWFTMCYQNYPPLARPLSYSGILAKSNSDDLWSCIATSLYAREVIIFYFTNIDNLYISLYFTILVLWMLQLWVQKFPVLCRYLIFFTDFVC